MRQQVLSASPRKVIALANKQLGYHEGRSKNGWNNHQKFSAQVPGLEWSQNQPWCATFVSWLALKSGFPTLYPKTASCDTAAAWYKKKGRFSDFPAVGAQMFLGSSKDYYHTGLVVDFDATHIFTIEGNTNKTGSSQGDGVYRMKRLRKEVGGYGLPKFKEGIVSADPRRAKEAPKAGTSTTTPTKKTAAKDTSSAARAHPAPTSVDLAIAAAQVANRLHPGGAVGTALKKALVDLSAAKKALAS
jgi:hypothetical protein